jgi:hypothetical protein
MEFLAVEALVSDLHPRTERADRRKIFYYETMASAAVAK